MGTTLSGGQQQRVMLARALYRQPRLLVMDEGTGALDIGTEQRVNNALKDLSITRIIAAHRPETLATADRIIVLENGQLKQVERKPRALADRAKHEKEEKEQRKARMFASKQRQYGFLNWLGFRHRK